MNTEVQARQGSRACAKGVPPAPVCGISEQGNDADMPRLARHLVERLVSLTGDQLDVSHGHQVLAQRVLLAAGPETSRRARRITDCP